MHLTKLTQNELSRSINIFVTVFDAIAPDLDTIDDFRYTNRNCMEMCVDYVHAYGPDTDADAAFMSELYERVGYGNVIKQLCKAYSLV
jgi:hypothetical protein